MAVVFSDSGYFIANLNVTGEGLKTPSPQLERE